MAYIGLAKPTIATYTDGKVYTDGFRCGKAIDTSITPQFAEGSLFGDNMKAEYDKEFKYADITLNTTELPVTAHEKMFGHKTSEESEIQFNANDESKYVGYGFYVTEKVNGIRKYVAAWLKKCKFTEGADNYKTKGDTIEYQTPGLSGQALAEDDGTWKIVKIFNTEKEAQDWLDTKAGIKPVEEP